MKTDSSGCQNGSLPAIRVLATWTVVRAVIQLHHRDDAEVLCAEHEVCGEAAESIPDACRFGTALHADKLRERNLR
jgi:hypothetical protein